MSPLVGSFLESRKGEWKSKVSGCHGLKGEGATRLRILASQILNLARKSGGTEDQPEPTPGPNHHQNSIRYILHQERERVVQQLQNRRQIADAARLHFPLSKPRRQRVNLRPAVSTLGPSLHSVAALPHRAAPVRHQSSQSLQR